MGAKVNLLLLSLFFSANIQPDVINVYLQLAERDSDIWVPIDDPASQLHDFLGLKNPYEMVYGHKHAYSGLYLFKAFSQFDVRLIENREVCVSRAADFIVAPQPNDHHDPVHDILRYPLSTYLLTSGDTISECSSEYLSGRYLLVSGTNDFEIIDQLRSWYMEHLEQIIEKNRHAENAFSVFVDINKWGFFEQYPNGSITYSFEGRVITEDIIVVKEGDLKLLNLP